MEISFAEQTRREIAEILIDFEKYDECNANSAVRPTKFVLRTIDEFTYGNRKLKKPQVLHQGVNTSARRRPTVDRPPMVRKWIRVEDIDYSTLA